MSLFSALESLENRDFGRFSHFFAAFQQILTSFMCFQRPNALRLLQALAVRTEAFCPEVPARIVRRTPCTLEAAKAAHREKPKT